VLDVGHAPLCLILSGEPSYCDCSTCSPAPVVPLASAHSPKQRRISFFAKSGGIFVACEAERTT